MKIIRASCAQSYKCVSRSLLAATLIGFSTAAAPFTQSGATIGFVGSGVPMGHEWLTRLSALELLAQDPLTVDYFADPRRNWKQDKDGLGLAIDEDLGNAQTEVERILASKVSDYRYESGFKAILSAILGERWVDIGGFNVTKSNLSKYNCFDAVAQEPASIQQDHFMRRYDDIDSVGGVKAAQRSQNRFIEHFVAAATAIGGEMQAYDGGGYSKGVTVDRNYYFFGRAVHLFQDSFSSEHTVRKSKDNYTTIKQVKSYMCAAGSEQHSHSTKAVTDYSSGDVIWRLGTRLNLGWKSYMPSLMKDEALVATEASKDLWAAFIRTMSEPDVDKRKQAATTEAKRLVKNWLYINKEEAEQWYENENNRSDTYVLATDENGSAKSQSDCMIGLGVPSGLQQTKVEQLEHAQKMCIYNIESVPGSKDNDKFLKIPFNWKWKSSIRWETPPESWKIPELPAVAQ